MKAGIRKSKDQIEDRAVMGEVEIQTAIESIAGKILEYHPDIQKILLVGIRTGGVYLAERLKKILESRTSQRVQMGVLDITLYRDDPFIGLPRPEVGSTELPCPIEKKTVILVDDVLFTGRTIRAALEEIMDFGRPKCVELAVLIDRGHRELPIRPDYTGLKVKTRKKQSVLVFLSEQGHSDRVAVFNPGL